MTLYFPFAISHIASGKKSHYKIITSVVVIKYALHSALRERSEGTPHHCSSNVMLLPIEVQQGTL